MVRYLVNDDPRLNGFATWLGEPMITVEDPAILEHAMRSFERGLDCADALHLASAMSARCSGFATFDRSLVKYASRHGVRNVAEP